MGYTGIIDSLPGGSGSGVIRESKRKRLVPFGRDAVAKAKAYGKGLPLVEGDVVFFEVGPDGNAMGIVKSSWQNYKKLTQHRDVKHPPTGPK